MIRAAMSGNVQLVVFRIDDCRYSLPLATVEHVVRAVAVTPLTHAPRAVLGVVDVRGRIVPVFNLRGLFRLPERDVTPDDQFLIARTAGRMVALAVDEALGVLVRPHEDVTLTMTLTRSAKQTAGVAKLEDGLVLIHDLEQFLSAAETEALEGALRQLSVSEAGPA